MNTFFYGKDLWIFFISRLVLKGVLDYIDKVEK